MHKRPSSCIHNSPVYQSVPYCLMTPTTRNRRAARLCLPQQPEEAVSLLHVALIERLRLDWIVHSAGLFLLILTADRLRTCDDRRTYNLLLTRTSARRLKTRRGAQVQPVTGSRSACGRCSSVAPESCPYSLAKVASEDASSQCRRAIEYVWTEGLVKS